MSGGSFCGSTYPQGLVSQFADELENRIENNNTPDEYGYAPELPKEIIDYLNLQVTNLRKLSEVMRAIDFLYAGDCSELSFMKTIGKIEAEK